MTMFGKSNEKTPAVEIECEKVVERMPAAGPHARADLTNFDACPGSGVSAVGKRIWPRQRSRRRLKVGATTQRGALKAKTSALG